MLFFFGWVWMGVRRPCPPVRNDIVTPRTLVQSFLINWHASSALLFRLTWFDRFVRAWNERICKLLFGITHCTWTIENANNKKIILGRGANWSHWVSTTTTTGIKGNSCSELRSSLSFSPPRFSFYHLDKCVSFLFFFFSRLFHWY